MKARFVCPRVKQKVELTPAELPNGVCCEEHRRQLMKFSELSQILPNVDMTDLAFYFARQCQNNKKAARTARRLTAVSQRAPMPEDKPTSPFHIVDHLLASPTGIYGMELNSRPFHELCSPQELRVSFERYSKALKFEDYNVIPFAFDVQLKFRSLSFLSKEQIYNRLMSMTRVNLRETKINRVHKDSMIHVHSVVDPFVTPRAIQSIVQDKNGNFIRLSIYNWYTTLTDQSDEQIRNRLRAERHFIIGNPFVKMAADGLLTLRVDNPRLEIWFTDYEKELEQMDADRLRDWGKFFAIDLNASLEIVRQAENEIRIIRSSLLGNKCFAADDTHSAIEYYTLGLTKSPLDTRILTNRAECYLQSRLPHFALIDCDRILKIYADNPTAENTDVRFTWKVHYRRMRALISLQLYELAKAAGDPMVASVQAVSSAHSEIVDRFRRIIDTDVPRLQRESSGHYEMKDFLVEPLRKSDAFVAEFERTDACEFRACDQQVTHFESLGREMSHPLSV